MPEALSHLEQYKMLREEIMQHMREMYRTEFWGATAVAAVYAFLLTAAAQGPLPTKFMWVIPQIVILICGLRVCLLFGRIGLIARYLGKIEDDAFQNEPSLSGWQQYLVKDKKAQRNDWVVSCATVALWLAAFFASAAASWYFCCRADLSRGWAAVTRAYPAQVETAQSRAMPLVG